MLIEMASENSSTMNELSTTSITAPSSIAEWSSSKFTSSTTSNTVQSTTVVTSGQSNKTVVTGSVVGSIFGLVLLVLFILFYFRMRGKYKVSRGTYPKEEQALKIEPFDLKPDFNPLIAVAAEQQRGEKLDLDPCNPTLLERDPATMNLSSFQTAPSIQSSVTPSTTFTARQLQLQSQVDELRDHVSQLGSASDTVGIGDAREDMQTTIDQLRAHIRALENLLTSDWAMGLTDDPPPVYTVA
ncbi:hypothetical protein VKT23_013082 [Stygiomarasmius scandens]|uniref:Uncharacterized protein n=1 Tax=Marasmiellus scandens TaxID=2682957 RepID=A0ABR1J531_9AGAR